jgi:hypothetical protein
MKLFFVGPSHIPRIRHAIENVGIPRPAKEIIYLGDGGYPVWNKSIFERCCADFQPGDTILLIVADFRFGNSVLMSQDALTAENVFLDGYTHVKRELCTLDSDLKMKQRCLDALLIWKKRFGEGLVIFHWTLAMRTAKNRLAHIHTDKEGKYTHPTWNINEDAMLGDVNYLDNIQTSSELDICNAMMIDNDLHPSSLGYLYINGTARYRDHNLAIASARSIYMAGLNALTSRLTKLSTKRTVICGDSSAIVKLKKAIPLGTLKALSELGVDFRLDIQDLSLVQQVIPFDQLIYFSNRKLDSSRDEDFTLLRTNSLIPKTIIFFWDAFAALIMQWRARNQRGLPTGMRERLLTQEILRFFIPNQASFEFCEFDRIIEHGAGGAPTAWALFLLIARTQKTNNVEDLAHLAIEGMQRAAKSHYSNE